MDNLKAIKSVTNMTSYLSLTQSIADKTIDELPFNMSTVLSIKKLCSFEVEYFIKCQENGAAFTIFEHLLTKAPSKTWGLLAKELVSLLSYWIEGLRKHLISHCPHWWIFLKRLLKFIKDIGLKDNAYNNIMVDQLAESLLDLATNDYLDMVQKIEVIKCLNQFCAASSRQLRSNFANKFTEYFIKLSNQMALCDHVPSQLLTLELLLRWLLGRSERGVRQVACSKWFPASLYGEDAIQVFLERSFKDFFKDARDFLNAHNAWRGRVTSVLCRRLTVGSVSVISGTERLTTWLDINSSHECMTMLMDPRLFLNLGLNNIEGHETMTISRENALKIELARESRELLILVKTANGPAFLNEVTRGLLHEDLVKFYISTRSDKLKLDQALSRAFGDKYTCTLNSEDGHDSMSPPDLPEINKTFSGSEEDARCSISGQVQRPIVRRPRRSGYATRSRCRSGFNTPSTTSTTSLVQLHEKLAALPRLRYEKEPIGVCALPDLSCVTEISEPDGNTSFSTTNSTLKVRACGVSQRKRLGVNSKCRTSPSDNEDTLNRKLISPAKSDIEKPTSCLFVATVGSTDESVINDTLERLHQSKGDLASLFIQEAFLDQKTKERDDNFTTIFDSGFITSNNGEKTDNAKVNSEIEDTPIVFDQTKSAVNKNTGNKIDDKKPRTCTIISKSTSEESDITLNANTITDTTAEKKITTISVTEDSSIDGYTETPKTYVNIRKRNYKDKRNFGHSNKNISENEPQNEFDMNYIEDFFAQNFSESKSNDLIISADFARKMNESSSDSSESFDKYLNTNVENCKHMFKVNINDIEDCLRDLVDKICNEQKQKVEHRNSVKANNVTETKNPIKVSDNLCDLNELSEDRPKDLKKTKVKLSYKVKKETIRKKREINYQSSKKQNTKDFKETVYENEHNCVDDKILIEQANESKPSESPFLKRRKRKLYSPKDDDAVETEEEDIIPLSTFKNKSKPVTPIQETKTKIQTPKTTPTIYKEIEKERRNYIRQPRNRKSMKLSTPSLSPKTLKNNELFDKIKENKLSKEMANVEKKPSELDIIIYNFTSDSEDEDFKKKKFEACRSRTNSIKSKHNGSDLERTKEKKKRATKKQNTKAKKNKPVTATVRLLEDEKMREDRHGVLNTSLVVENEINKDVSKSNCNISPKLISAPKMEFITDNTVTDNCITIESKNSRIKSSDKVSSSKKKKKTKCDTKEINTNEVVQHERSESPLPDLIIESARKQTDGDDRSTTSSNLVKKCQRLIQDGTINETTTTQHLLSDGDNYNPDIPVELEISQKLMAGPRQHDIKTNISIDEKNPKSSQIEVLEVSSTQDTLEKSIATIGNSPITAHGDFDEAPPSQKYLHETIEPRNLELENLTPSGKEYFLQLRDEINKSSNKMNENSSVKSISSQNMLPDRKPTSLLSSVEKVDSFVYLTKLTDDEIRRWLPSPKSSVTCSSSVAKEKIKTPETEPKFEKYKYSVMNSNKSHFEDTKNKSDTKKDRVQKNIISIPDEYRKKLRSGITNVKKEKSKVSKKVDQPCRVEKHKYISAISPIHFDSTDEDEITEHTELNRSSPILNIMSPKFNSSTSKSKTFGETINTMKNKTKNSQSSLSIRENSSRSTTNTYKRTPESPCHSSPKKLKKDLDTATEVATATYLSTDSVATWFARDATRNDVEHNEHLVCMECIPNIMEKLDTTLTEINQSTTRKFVNLFVEMQEYRNKLQEQRDELFKNMVRDTLRDMVQVMENNFLQINDKFDQLDNDMKQHFQQSAADLIREDCRQKRAMVVLLKEDVQAVQDHLEKKRKRK